MGQQFRPAKLFLRLVVAAATMSGIAYAQAPTATPASPEELSGNETEINVKNAEIGSILRIFSKKTKRNYILDDRVKGKVSIYLPGKVSSDEALRILESVLNLKGFASVPIGENLWKIVPSKEAKQSTIPTRLENPEGRPSTSVVTRLLALKYVGAEEVQQLVSQLISPDGLLNAYTATNSLIIIDSEDNIARISEIVNALDVPSTDRDMTIVPIKYAEAADIAAKLTELLAPSQTGAKEGSDPLSDLLRVRASQAANPGSQPMGGAPGGGASSGSGGTPGKSISTKGREPKILADERTNSVVVVADEETTARIKALISQLDSKVDLSGNRFYVYRCQHAKADELAEVLSGLSEGGGKASTSTSSLSSSNRGGASSGADDDDSGFGSSGSSRNSATQMRNRTLDRLSSQKRSLGQSRLRDSAKGVSSASIGEDISITADPSTNSLIINAGKADYEKILELLKQLDIKRRQVLVEATLLEVAFEDGIDLGTDWITSGGGADGGFFASRNQGNQNLTSLLTDPRQLTQFTAAAASSGTLTLPNNIQVPSQAILVSAAQTNENINVLSAPQILTTDNEEAAIIVGQNVPFLASTSTNESNLNNTFNQVDRQDVGITLRLTPQISSDEYVKMTIFTEVSNVILATLASPLGPTTTIRTSETTVISKDGQMVVIGGLLSDEVSSDEGGVPYLKDIPVLGHIFRDSSEATTKRNLLIFITPRIVRDQFDARDLTVENRDEVQGEIVGREIYPNRTDVLENRAIDTVTEDEEFKGQKPSTILPPESAYENMEGRNSETEMSKKFSAAQPEIRSFKADSPGVIELKVAPKLPELKPLHEGKSGRAPKQSSTYIVFELSGNKKVPLNLPFPIDSKSRRFGVEIPEGSDPSFFEVGENFAYMLQGKEIPVTQIGSFGSKDDASSVLDSPSWYTLSPYEIMSLGSGPWRKIDGKSK